jgi:hypothetical protein
VSSASKADHCVTETTKGSGIPSSEKIVKIVNRGHSFVARERMPELSKTTVSLAENFVFGMHGANCAESFGIQEAESATARP